MVLERKIFLNDFVCRNQIKLAIQKPLNEEKCEDTKAVIRSRKSKDRQHNHQKCEDTKGIIRSRKNLRTDNTMTKSVRILKG